MRGGARSLASASAYTLLACSSHRLPARATERRVAPWVPAHWLTGEHQLLAHLGLHAACFARAQLSAKVQNLQALEREMLWLQEQLNDKEAALAGLGKRVDALTVRAGD